MVARASPENASYNCDNFFVIGIGASAGGLEACKKLVEALPADSDMAFILVQHLDPTHESMMVDLLSSDTSIIVQEAKQGMPLEAGHFYTIPPGKYLSVANGALHLSQPQAPHGARLPFDFLLSSLAEEFGTRAICVVLSGTGADGSLGLKTIKEKGGLVIVQDPGEAAYNGMPQSAIATGMSDLVLPVAKIPAAFVKKEKYLADIPNQIPARKPQNFISEIIELLRTQTVHDFTLYKQGTLKRRIERRMAMIAIEPKNTDRYLEVLHNDPKEIPLLAKDLLINVTGFFRDPEVFDLLAKKIIPDLVRGKAPDQALRIWISGCSTGEEAYSLAMLFKEQITQAKLSIKLQVFTSDVDADAITQAREGFYPETIVADVSPARLARFFSREINGYKVSSELRGSVVFTVQDVLADPPFSRLDMISCRNLLIYLGPEAQARVISLFHFALREDGMLLLGMAETPGNIEGRFEAVSKAERVYRRIGRSRPGEFGFLARAGEGVQISAHAGQDQRALRQGALFDLCQRLVTDTYAPAAVLINRKHECLYSLGATDRYLRVAPGHPTHDVLAMARPDLRIKLRAAIQQATEKKARIVIAGGRINQNGKMVSFNIDVQPVSSEGDDMLLICFVDASAHEPRFGRVAGQNSSQVAELEKELEETRQELQSAVRHLELSSEEQKTINQETLSVNEEYQSTNEELLTSKEELQSLNEELTALNSQIQETLERQRTTSNDLQNILYSTDVATLFLDTDLNIRFFTPATKSLFNVIAGDIGRPLADLHSLAEDNALSDDARAVLRNLTPIDREIETEDGICFIRRILPYRTHDNGVEGVVITFTDITERKHTAKALEETKHQAELANVAKSRFLAAASHDLRQPLQTLALLQGLLAKIVKGAQAQTLVARLDQTLDAMSAMLNTLLDINQIEAGTVHAEMVGFPINTILNRLREDFHYQAQAKNLDLKVIPCGLSIYSDLRLLEQMLRNLLANALKYTEHGKVMLGCRRKAGMLSIEIWDTGIGIPEKEYQAIFEEYHQLDSPARERSLGLGLGLSIVQRLGNLMGHKVHVRSQRGKGSVFTIEVGLSSDEIPLPFENQQLAMKSTAKENIGRIGTILVIEDDQEVRTLLELFLKDAGHRVATAADGRVALKLVTREKFYPDLILADYNLPNGMHGLQIASKLREKLKSQVPVIVLTGDISTGSLRDIALQNCVQLNKPVKLKELTKVIQQLLPAQAQPDHLSVSLETDAKPTIFIIDDDDGIRAVIRSILEEKNWAVEDYATGEDFLKAYSPGRKGCILIDVSLPGMTGLDLLARLNRQDNKLPAIIITGHSDVPMAVQAMKGGASDFIEKPISQEELVASIQRALEQSEDSGKLLAHRETAARNLAGLTSRQLQIMELVLAGHPSKNIATDLGISQRTVENHRAVIMKKTGAKSLPALARLALTASLSE